MSDSRLVSCVPRSRSSEGDTPYDDQEVEEDEGDCATPCQLSALFFFVVGRADVLLINVLTELIRLIILDLTLPSCICPPPPPKEGSEVEEEPQPTMHIILC